MGVFDNLERKLERVVNGAFARAFKGEVVEDTHQSRSPARSFGPGSVKITGQAVKRPIPLSSVNPRNPARLPDPLITACYLQLATTGDPDLGVRRCTRLPSPASRWPRPQ